MVFFRIGNDKFSIYSRTNGFVNPLGNIVKKKQSDTLRTTDDGSQIVGEKFAR